MSTNTSARIAPPVRDEYEIALAPTAPAGAVPTGDPSAVGERDIGSAPLARPSAFARLRDAGWLRKMLIAFVLIAGWEFAARAIDNDLLLPTFSATALAFAQGIANGELPAKIAVSLSVLLRGYALGVACAFALTTLAVTTRIGRDLHDDAGRDVQSAAVDRAAAARVAVVRPRHGQPAVRARARGALAASAKHVRGLSGGARDAQDGRPQLRADGLASRRLDPDSGRAAVDSRGGRSRGAR